MVIKKIKEAFSKKPKEEYLEVDIAKEPKKTKILVKPFILKSFEDTTRILNALREGYTIAVIDIGPLRSRDLIEVKRAVSKIKKTVEALEGDIAGFGENILIAVPNFAEISKEERTEIVEETK